LVLFRFPESGPDAGRLVAELISEPSTAKPPGPHDHQAEVQILTGDRPGPPTRLNRGDRVEITVAGKGAVARAQSFVDHVPRLSAVAARSEYPNLRRGPTLPRNADLVRNTITVNRGVIRARSLATWDVGGFPLSGATGAAPAQLVDIKFMGADVRGHMANECVLEVSDADAVRVDANEPALRGEKRPIRAPNHHTSGDSVDILIDNFEFQRAKPVPWGMDFQWLFHVAGYEPVDLSGDELARFRQFASAYDAALYDEDRATLLPTDPMGHPFPYVVGNPSAPLRALSEWYSRPICVPGEE
jgi:hypothetical protein